MDAPPRLLLPVKRIYRASCLPCCLVLLHVLRGLLYESWDIILFPMDSHVLIQGFMPACCVTHDGYARPSPTLTCFIASLPPGTPFRVSIHSWTKPCATSVIESRRK